MKTVSSCADTYYRVSFTLAQKNFGNSEISDFDSLFLLIKQNVLSLEVSMKDLFGVDML